MMGHVYRTAQRVNGIRVLGPGSGVCSTGKLRLYGYCKG
jgi:hypothetical protein